MSSDSSKAQDALRDQAEASEKPADSAEGGNLQSGKTASQARLFSEHPPAAGDPDDEARSLLSELTVGSVVDGKYKVDAVLGRGAMGVVVAATHVGLDERVALKFLRYRAKGGATDDFQTRFRREARVSARLKNEHITRVIDVGVWHERVPYMVMDYLTGTDLRDVIKKNGPLPVGTAIDYVVQVCEGIAEAHAHGIVHRDLKPSNLFVTQRPDGSDLVKVLDFGISKWSAGEAEVEELTQTGVVLGSPKYMSPEQLFGSSAVDSRADVWSIGAILYEMLCGRPPFDLPTFTKICAELSTNHPPPSLHERRPEISQELDAAVMRCFMRDPAQRTQNVAELAGEVLDAVGAPFAGQVRQKISAMLDARVGGGGGSGAMGATGGRIPTLSGSYAAVLSITGSTGGSHRSAVEALTSSHPGSMDEESGKGKRSKLWIAILATIVVGGGAIVALRARGENNETPAASAAAVSASAPTASAAVPQAMATATATTTVTEAAPPPPVASATATATTTPVATAEPTHHTPRWQPPPPTHRGGSTPKETAAPAPPPPPPPPQPVATTPPPAAQTAKPDPLGDRQ